jgi:2-polyprenyl-3-methyl-5-hydroxy-6-metoxy-1,4-benzoquinol methylase
MTFRQRDPDLIEAMDRPDADPGILFRTYQRFRLINRLLAKWDVVYKHHIRPSLKPGVTNTLLDVGCGGGDIAIYLWKRAKKDGYVLNVTAIDPADSVEAYLKANPLPADIPYRNVTTRDLVNENQRFDFVISNHVLHHLKPEEVTAFLNECMQLANVRVICNDLRRSRRAWILFYFASIPFSFGTFIRYDGLISIRRSYRCDELIQALPGGWSVHKLFPFRLLVMRNAHD